ncbi:MAG: M48 family metallopeptidase [Opitutaceae bacterium]
MLSKPLHILAALAPAALFLAGCYTVPETGRRSLNLISPSQELQMGAMAFREIKQTEKVSTDADMNQTVNRVGQRIAKVVGDDLPDAEWEFVVFEDEDPNAFALPGGKVGVHTGLFKVAETDDELAVVMGHEIAHVTARHGAERVSQGLLLTAGGVALDVALRDEDSGTRNLALAAYGVGSTVGVMLPYSRLNESEADEIGMIYAARAGYDPRAAVDFWTSMQKESEGKAKPPEWLSTHPSDTTRIERLKEMMPRMVEIYNKSDKQ